MTVALYNHNTDQYDSSSQFCFEFFPSHFTGVVKQMAPLNKSLYPKPRQYTVTCMH